MYERSGYTVVFGLIEYEICGVISSIALKRETTVEGCGIKDVDAFYQAMVSLFEGSLNC